MNALPRTGGADAATRTRESTGWMGKVVVRVEVTPCTGRPCAVPEGVAGNSERRAVPIAARPSHASLSSTSTSVDHADARTRACALMAFGGSDAAVAAEARLMEAEERIHSLIPVLTQDDALRLPQSRNAIDTGTKTAKARPPSDIRQASQSSTLSDGTRLNSRVLCVTSVQPNESAWAASRVSSGPIGAPRFSRPARIEP